MTEEEKKKFSALNLEWTENGKRRYKNDNLFTRDDWYFLLDTNQDLLVEQDKHLIQTKSEIKLRTKTADDLLKMVESKDAEITDLRKKLNNLRAIREETNDYDNAMRGLNL